MRYRTILFLAALALIAPLNNASAAISGFNFPLLKVSTPDTPTSLLALIGCEENSQIYDITANIQYIVKNCSSTPVLHKIWPPQASDLEGLDTSIVPEAGSNFYFTNGRAMSAVTGMNVSAFVNDVSYITASALTPYLTIANAASTYATLTALANKLTTPTGTGTQYLDGTGAPKNFAAPGSWTFQYPSHALAACFQISTTQDTNVTYSVDINAGLLTLGGGTATLTTYTNSGCSTGAQVIANGAVSSVALSGTSSIPLTGWVPAGKWAKVAGTGTGGGTATIDAVQSEALKP